MNEQLKNLSIPENYYYVTHLTNPAQTFFSRLNTDVEMSPELAAKLAHGTQLHRFTSIWMKNLDDFIVEEATIDGAWVGISGVRGKIDYRIGDSILEFKTKDCPPETPDEIISLYPQDLEQLAFYSIIHPSKPDVNYLVFMKNSPPYDIKAYKIIIKDFGTIKSILKTRINVLNNAFKTKDPSHLGQCRYHDSNCHFQSSGSCSCDELKPINISPLLKSVEIKYDEKFTKKLELARDSSEYSESSSLYTIDIIAPRKHYMKLHYEFKPKYNEGISPSIDRYKALMWTSLQNLKRKHQIELSNSERQELYESQRESRLSFGFRWLKIKSSIHPEGEIVPYLLKVSQLRYLHYSNSPNEYHSAELGITCAAYGKSKGLIFVLYPNLDNLVRVFQVTYKNGTSLLKLIKENIAIIEKAEKENNLLYLPPCPNYMNDNGECQLMNECNSPNGNGCLLNG